MAPMQEPDFADKTLAKLKVCFDELYNRSDTQQKIAVIGFCFGGSYSFSLAANEPRLKAALPFYGHTTTDIDELKKIHCPIQAFYGQNDEGLMGSLEEVKQLMKTAGVNFKVKVYPDAGHAFFNDTNKIAYNQTAAKDAWQLSLEFLKQTLA
jgi:carboxymethylenebutenolidase